MPSIATGRPDRSVPRGGFVLPFVVFAVAFVVFAVSPVKTPYDSRWSIHTAASLLHGEGGSLGAYRPVLATNDFYAITTCRGEPRTIFPIGVSVLATPMVAIASLVAPSFEERLATSVPATFEKVVASFYGALAVAFFFMLVQARFGSVPIAVTSAAVLAFGTSMWSMATRALWQHGPLMLMLTVTMLLLERSKQNPKLAGFVGLPLAAAFIIRPTAAIPIAVLGCWLLIYNRRALIGTVLGGLAVAAVWFAFNIATCGSPIPDYFLPGRLDGQSTFAEALAGNLVSPARGLLVFSPVLLFAIPGFVRAVRARQDRGLALAYGLIVVLHWIAVSHFPHWWAGHSYGPRLMSDILPFLVYFVAFALAGLATLPRRSRRAAAACFGVLMLASVAVHLDGATRYAGWSWNVLPENVDAAPARLWDWRDPPFLR
ncbi:hypothetical protein A33M_0934 [Rhodovulum sp. PH10]|nr:hypothetical protein A33M_0934 [Rhodovulum sp. PH10]